MNKDDLKRIVLATLVCLVVMLGWQWYTMRHQAPAPPADQTDSTVPSASAASAPAPAPSAAPTPSLLQAAPEGRWHVKRVEPYAGELVMGSLTPDDGYKAEIHFDENAAAVAAVKLSEFKWHVTDKETGYPLLNPPPAGQKLASFQLGLLKFENRGEVFDLSQSCWRTEGPTMIAEGAMQLDFAAEIVDEDEALRFRIIKRFLYRPGDYNVTLTLLHENHAAESLKVASIEMLGPVGVLREDPRMDRRNITVGYARNADFEVKQIASGKFDEDKALIRVDSVNDKSLAWYALSNKFFAVIVRSLAEGENAPAFAQNTVEAVNLLGPGQFKKENNILAVFSRLAAPALAPQTIAAYGFEIYLGPIDKTIFDKDFPGRHYEKLVPSSWCSFDWLTFALLGLLKALYKLIGNYGVAIMLFVLLVRLILHPITKKSQVNMMKMSKLAPLMEELKKKYANNPQELQKKMAEMYKEQSSGMLLGCLPMFLQMPIWFALYTAVDTNVAMRHQGLFPPSWHWITDLTAPDRLIPFTWFHLSGFHIPLVGFVDAVNLLPILLCIAMVLQMKLSPQMQMTQANPQQAAQQKMMMWMMPIMMLVFLYTGPSGLNLYIMASTFGGVIEQHYIRKHIKQQQELEAQGVVAVTAKIGAKFEPKKPKERPPQKFI